MGEQLGDATRPVRATEEDASREGDLSRLRRVGRWLGMVVGRGESKDGERMMAQDDTHEAEEEQRSNGKDPHAAERRARVIQAIAEGMARYAAPPGVLEVGPQRPLDHRWWGPGILDLVRPGEKHDIDDAEFRANRRKTIESLASRPIPRRES